MGAGSNAGPLLHFGDVASRLLNVLRFSEGGLCIRPTSPGDHAAFPG
jgi:hypothetical protein